MTLDLTKRGKDVDLGLRLSDYASETPANIKIVGGVDESGRAYRLLKLDPQGALYIAPSREWGAGERTPIIDFAASNISGNVTIGMLEGWKYGEVMIYFIGSRAQPGEQAPKMSITADTPTGTSDTIWQVPIVNYPLTISYRVSLPPTACRLLVNTHGSPQINNVRIVVLPLTPGYEHRLNAVTGTLVDSRTQGTPVANVVGQIDVQRPITLLLGLEADNMASVLSAWLELRLDDGGMQYIYGTTAPVIATSDVVSMRVDGVGRASVYLRTNGGSGNGVFTVTCSYWEIV